ncbi:MAG: hypothetical protein WBZ29_09065 [Methanocella sp.]
MESDRALKHDLDDLTWQEFEELLRDILDQHNFEVKFRKVFKFNGRGYQIDVVGYRKDLCLCIDGKKYGRGRYRASSIKAEALKHYKRCLVHEEAFSIRSIPVIVSWIDDNLITENGCIILPVHMLNDFLLNLDYILDDLGYNPS